MGSTPQDYTKKRALFLLWVSNKVSLRALRARHVFCVALASPTRAGRTHARYACAVTRVLLLAFRGFICCMIVEALNCLITTDTIRNAHELVRRRGVGAVGEVKNLSSTPPNTSKSDAMPVSCPHHAPAAPQGRAAASPQTLWPRQPTHSDDRLRPSGSQLPLALQPPPVAPT